MQIIDCRTPEYSVITDNPSRLLVDMIHWDRQLEPRIHQSMVVRRRSLRDTLIYTSDGPTYDGTIRYRS